MAERNKGGLSNMLPFVRGGRRYLKVGMYLSIYLLHTGDQPVANGCNCAKHSKPVKSYCHIQQYVHPIYVINPNT